jgi:serine phosphatase RsbU (regulator of sigma subunit)
VPTQCNPPTATSREQHGAQVRYDALIALAAKWNRVATVEEAALALVAGVKFVLSLDVWRFALLEDHGPLVHADHDGAVTIVEGTLDQTSVEQCHVASLSALERSLFASSVHVLLDADSIAKQRDELPSALRERAMNTVYGLASQGPTGRAEHVLVIGTRATLSPLDVKFAGLLGGLFADKVRQLRAEAKLRTAYQDLAERDSRIYADLCESRDFQRSLLPKLDPLPGIEIASVFEPIEMVGGDVYDVAVLPDGTLRVFVVDATGHGLQAAMRTMVLLSEYNNLKYRAQSAGDLLRALNKRLSEHHTPLELLSPAVCADIYPQGSGYACVIANAGAPPTLIAGTSGPRILEAGGSMLLGMSRDIALEEIETVLEPGDRLLFATDGLYDQRDQRNNALAYEPCLDALARAATVPSCVAALRELFDAHRGGADRDDDVTAVCIGVIAQNE